MAIQNKYILSIDQGTSSSRALLFDHDTNIVGVAQKEFKQYYPNEGWVEHNAMEIWDTQRQVIDDCISKSKIDIQEIAAIGITNQRETTIVWDTETGEPVHHAIVWQDRRTADECSKIKATSFADKIANKTGLIVDAYFSASKLKWLLDHVPGLREKANVGKVKFGTVDSWLIYKLTKGRCHYTDVTNASRTMLFNIHQLVWDQELLDYFDIPAQILPAVLPSNANYGFASIGDDEIPIYGVAGDQQSALFGQNCLGQGATKVTYGTGCFMMTNTGNQVVRSNNQLLSTIGWQLTGEPAVYAMEGSVFVGGAVISWLRDGLKIIDDSAASEMKATSVKDSNGVVFVPALTGLGAPHWDQYARGMIIGITRDTTDAHIIRAALESIALQVNDLITAMEQDLQVPIPSIKVDGGAIQNKLLLKMQAGISNKEIVVPKILESTALGAALLAGLFCNFWKDLDEITRLWQTEQSVFPVNIQEYDTLKIQWKKAVERSKNWIDQLD